ncbi:hypothetical protein RD792_011621 [Penstemon davidsonii]|uniref:Uncharacterized protein n=1 Tax=Penstemon davidsonii TaxID=160366 RepID=A0ABR0CW96_9LAMI|nr:hypothetical protein RD792_011621 [Penstemon davidsonii]
MIEEKPRISLVHLMRTDSKYSRVYSVQSQGWHHWVAAKKLMRYLKRTKDFILVYKRVDNLEVLAFTNSDFAGCPDDMKSTYDPKTNDTAVTTKWNDGDAAPAEEAETKRRRSGHDQNGGRELAATRSGGRRFAAVLVAPERRQHACGHQIWWPNVCCHSGRARKAASFPPSFWCDQNDAESFATRSGGRRKFAVVLVRGAKLAAVLVATRTTASEAVIG